MSSERHETVQLEDYLRILKERAWVIVPCVLVVFLAVLISSLRTTPLYSASAELQYDRASMNTVVFGYEVFGYDYDRDRTIQRAIAIVGKNKDISDDVKARLAAPGSPGADLSSDALSGMVSASAQQDQVNISATSPDPAVAAAVANAFAEEFVAYRKESTRTLIEEARKTLNSELYSMTPSELQSDYGVQLQDRVASLRTVEAMQDSDFKLLRKASIPGAPFTPQTKRDVTLAIVLGLVLGVGLAFLLEYLDKRIKDERTLEKVSGLPVLAGVPVVGRSWRRTRDEARTGEVVGFAGDRSPLLESFRTLRSTLQYFNVDGNLHKILITSGLPQEGKTVTTVNLAISLAMSGKRVIVLEADLRRPMVHEYLGLANEIGLSNVLAGNSSVPEALQLVSMDPYHPRQITQRRERARPLGASQEPILHHLWSAATESGGVAPVGSHDRDDLGTGASGRLSAHRHSACTAGVGRRLPWRPARTRSSWRRGCTRPHVTRSPRCGGCCSRAGAHVIGVVAGGVKIRRGHYYRRGYYYRYGGYGYQ